jgi:hypothetical protein
MRHLTIEYGDPELKRAFFERFMVPIEAGNLLTRIRDSVDHSADVNTLILRWAWLMYHFETNYRVFISGQYCDLRRVYENIRNIDKLDFSEKRALEIYIGAVMSRVEKDITENELWELMPRHQTAKKSIYNWINKNKKKGKR